MAAKLEKTHTPGIYKRGSRYAVLYRGADGKQRQESAPTYDAARLLRAKREAGAREGVDHPHSRLSFGSDALDWVERYPGRGRRGFRDQTRHDYKRGLERYAIPFFDGQLRRTLVQVTPRDVARFVGWLSDDEAQGERAASVRRVELGRAGCHAEAEAIVAAPVCLADATVRRILAPVRPASVRRCVRG